MHSSRENIFKTADLLKSRPIVIEALWDGDSSGWFVRLYAVTNDQQSHELGVLQGSDGDMRLFNSQVPPWPEAVAAQEVGKELAERFGVEFYFPSPDHPEDACPDWRDKSKGYPCRRCQILLLQTNDCPWRGLCYHCYLEEEKEKREAKWTAEERAGPRCHICGNPATHELNHAPACAECHERYEVYTCEKCHIPVTILKSIGHTSLCSFCEIQITIDSLTARQRITIRKAIAKGGLEGIHSAMDIMGCSLHDAQLVLHVLGGSTGI